MFGVAQKDGHGRPSEDRIVARELFRGCRMFAVFDGHGGASTSDILMNELPGQIKAAIQEAGESWPASAKTILQNAFIRMDQDLAGPPSRVRASGAVAVMALLIPGEVIVAWVGDSPCILVDTRSGQVLRTTRLHHPTEADEAARIKAAGGSVKKDEYGTPRVDGGLMISRAFGDFSYKWSNRPPPETADWSAFKVTAFPEVERWPLTGPSLLILSSDGLLEGPKMSALPPTSIGERVHKSMGKYKTLNVAAKHVLEDHIGSAEQSPYVGDDLSLIIVPVVAAISQGNSGNQNSQSNNGNQGSQTSQSGGYKRMRSYRTRRVSRSGHSKN